MFEEAEGELGNRSETAGSIYSSPSSLAGESRNSIGSETFEEDNSSEYFSVLRANTTTGVSRNTRGTTGSQKGASLQSKNFVNTLRKRDHRDSVFHQVDNLTEKNGWLFKKRQGTSLFKPSVWQKRWVELKNFYLVYRRTSDLNSK